MSARVAGAFALAFAWVATATSQGAPRRVETLASGLRVIVDPTAGALELAVCARVRAGWSQDPPGYEGLAELTRRLLEGPTAHAPEGTALVLASRGVRQTRSDTRADATTWCTSGPPEALPAMLWAERERLAFFRSGLRENDVARARQRFLERLELRQGALGAALFGARDRALFGAAHPYARGVGPRPATLRRLGRDAVLRFHQDHYRPADVILALSGAVPEDARGQLRRVLGPLRAHEAPAPARETPTPPRLGRRGPLLLAWPADVEVREHAWRSPAYLAPGDAALDVVAALLEATLRPALAERGVDLRARQESRALASVFSVRFAAPAGSAALREAEDEVSAALASVAERGPPAGWLAPARRRARVRALRDADEPEARAWALAQASYAGAVVGPDELAARYRRLDAMALQAVVRRVLRPEARLLVRWDAAPAAPVAGEVRRWP